MKWVKFFLFLLPANILLLALPQSVYYAYTDSAVFEATKDTYANEAYPDKVNGGYNHVILSNKYTTRLGYLLFENVNIPEGAILDSATLKFYVYEQHYADTAKLNVGLVTGDWEENSLTWNNKPTINQTLALEAEISITDSGWKEISFTNLVNKWLDGTVENKGIFLYPYGFLYASPETEYAITFKSKESGENIPKLEIVYRFEPSPSPSPELSPSPSPEAEPTEEPEEVISEESPSPTPEESPSPSPEVEKRMILGIFSPGQALIAGLIFLALIGAGLSFVAYARRKPAEKPKKKEKSEEEKEAEEPE